MDGPRDVVLVTVDSLRADRCGFAGYDGETTPTIDELAAEGLVFENAIAPAAATSGSLFSLFTGEYPIERTTESSRADELRRHIEARDTLAERFARRGYHTVAITANPWTSRFFSFDQGFDEFEDFMDTDATSEVKRRKDDASPLVSGIVQLVNWWQGQDMYMAWEAIYDDIHRAIREAESPYLVWIFLVDVHMPYLPGSGYRSRSRLWSYLANAWLYADVSTPFDAAMHDLLEISYDDTIRYTDAFVRRLGEDLDALGENPLFVFHADHGEEFGDHGGYGHGSNLYEEVINVPLIVANGPTGRVNRPFSLFNFPDLVLSLAAGDGYASHLRSHARSRNAVPVRVVRGDGWKYIVRPDDEELLRVDAGTERPLDNDELLDIGRDIVNAWEHTDQEKQRIIEAAGSLSIASL